MLHTHLHSSANKHTEMETLTQGGKQAPNLGFIDFHPNLDMFLYSPPLDPFLLNGESYYFECVSLINEKHANASLLAIDKSVEKEKEVEVQTLLTSY